MGYETLGPLIRRLLPLPINETWRLIELGCGDMPVMPEILIDPHFKDARAVCVDYSGAVIRKLRLNDRTNPSLGGASSLSYEQADGRALTYKNSSFDLVFEKGTLDAMLSDAENGLANAHRICFEAARVLVSGGIFVIVSHVSPTGANGQAMLENSLVPALLGQSASFSWEIGVHFDGAAEETGPFVYVVRKCNRPRTRSVKRGEVQKDVPLHMHAY
jgi:SAM-dependent methyltransferase